MGDAQLGHSGTSGERVGRRHRQVARRRLAMSQCPNHRSPVFEGMFLQMRH